MNTRFRYPFKDYKIKIPNCIKVISHYRSKKTRVAFAENTLQIMDGNFV